MADLTYNIAINSGQATQSIDRLERQVSGLNTRMTGLQRGFGNFGNTIRTVAVGLAGMGMGRFIDDIQSMQNRLKLATTGQQEFAQSLKNVQIIADSTGQSLTATGSLYAKVAANAGKLGYSQEQVATVTASFAMALKASGASADGAASSIYQFSQILAKGKVNGDEFTTIMENLGGPVMDLVAAKLGTTTEGLMKMKEEGRLTAAMFSDALILSFAELNAMSGRTDQTLGQAFTRISNSFASMLIELEKTSGIFTNIAKGLAWLARNAVVLENVLAAMATYWAVSSIIRWGVSLYELVGILGSVRKAIIKFAATSAAAQALVTGGFSLLLGSAAAVAAYFGAKKLFGTMEEDAGAAGGALAELGATAAEQLGGVRSSTALTDEQLKRLAQTIESIQTYIVDFSSSYAQVNNNLENSLRLQTQQLAMTTAQANLAGAMAQAQETFLGKRLELENKINQIKNYGTPEEKAQLEKLQIALRALTREYETHKGAIAELTLAYEQAYAAKQLSIFQTQEQIRAENDLIRIQDEMAKMTMSEIERKYYDIEAAARASAKAAIEAEEARRQAALSPEEAAAYYEAALKGAERLKAATRQQYEASRTFSTGWRRAFIEYRENATNAAKVAESVFKKSMQGMEDVLVNFAKTGKFEWKGFVAMMLEELLRAQIQQVFAQMMGTMTQTMRGATGGGGAGAATGSGNILGSLAGALGGLFGGTQTQASAGRTPDFNPGAGSSGGFSDILGSLSGGIGRVVGSISSGIGSAISGISDFFGGFFANGGNLGAGRWGIAGERGPELISGPASITPLGLGGGTTVTYNINAVDAPSFQALVARDPGFIHAVVMAGARGQSGTRR